MSNLFGGSKSETTVTTPQNTVVNPTTNVYVGNEALNLDPIYRVVEANHAEQTHGLNQLSVYTILYLYSRLNNLMPTILNPSTQSILSCFMSTNPLDYSVFNERLK